MIEASSWQAALEELGAGSPCSTRSVGGGCINETRKIECPENSFFLKTNSLRRRGLFRAEAAGLEALSASRGGPRVPSVLALGDEESGCEGEQFLLLEMIEKGRPGPGTMADFGRSLARLHRSLRRDQSGFDGDNHIGATPQPNPWTKNWIAFFREHRLGFQLETAARRGLADRALRKDVEAVMARLDQILIPPDEERPSLIHGDLWGGNYLVDRHGNAVLIDPAVYYGHREADLAMTRLFGDFGSAFYGAYREEWPLERGFDERLDLYNLYHMLNHLNLFGGGYASSVRGICRRYR